MRLWNVLRAPAPTSRNYSSTRERLAGFKRPKKVVFGELPKTITGKIRKNELRAVAGYKIFPDDQLPSQSLPSTG